MNFPEDYKYSKEHSWVKVLDGGQALVGITEFAQSELGEIVYVDLPMTGLTFRKDEIFGSVEAVKTTSDLYMPVGGTVLVKNVALVKDASLANTSSFTDGWMIWIQLSAPDEVVALMNVQEYRSLVL